MIKIEFNKGKMSMEYHANMYESVECFVNLLDAIEEDFALRFAFEMAKRFRKDRDAKNNSDN